MENIQDKFQHSQLDDLVKMSILYIYTASLLKKEEDAADSLKGHCKKIPHTYFCSFISRLWISGETLFISSLSFCEMKLRIKVVMLAWEQGLLLHHSH